MLQTQIFILLTFGTIFITSSLFVDYCFIPKWIIMIAGGCLIGIIGGIMKIFNISNKSICVNKIIWGIVIIVLLQSLYGLLQYFSVCSSNSSFSITGSFDNPSGFSVTICAGIPFCLWAYSSIQKKYRFLVVISITILIVSLILSESRAGIVSVFVVMLVWYWKKISIAHAIKYLMFFISLIILLAVLYYFKRGSADGRILIWNCALPMLLENPYSGYGLGGFEAHYMDFQANYLCSHLTSHNSHLADDIQYPFCEYLYIAINHGLFGVLLLCLIFCNIIRIYMKCPSLDKRAALFCLLSIGVFALFSYPLMYPFVWLMIIFSIYILYKDIMTNFEIKNKFRKIFAIMSLVFFAYVGYKVYNRMHAELNWKQAVDLALLGKKKESLILYKMANEQLGTDRYFLYNYSAELFNVGLFSESLKQALKCRSHWASYDLELLLGQLYEQIGELNEAEMHYEKANCMCPNRFVPLYRLVKLLEKDNRINDAIIIAKKIVNKDVKIPSESIFNIKKEMIKYLSSKQVVI